MSKNDEYSIKYQSLSSLQDMNKSIDNEKLKLAEVNFSIHNSLLSSQIDTLNQLLIEFASILFRDKNVEVLSVNWGHKKNKTMTIQLKLNNKSIISLDFAISNTDIFYLQKITSATPELIDDLMEEKPYQIIQEKNKEYFYDETISNTVGVKLKEQKSTLYYRNKIYQHGVLLEIKEKEARRDGKIHFFSPSPSNEKIYNLLDLIDHFSFSRGRNGCVILRSTPEDVFFAFLKKHPDGFKNLCTHRNFFSQGSYGRTHSFKTARELFAKMFGEENGGHFLDAKLEQLKLCDYYLGDLEKEYFFIMHDTQMICDLKEYALFSSAHKQELTRRGIEVACLSLDEIISELAKTKNYQKLSYEEKAKNVVDKLFSSDIGVQYGDRRKYDPERKKIQTLMIKILIAKDLASANSDAMEAILTRDQDKEPKLKDLRRDDATFNQFLQNLESCSKLHLNRGQASLKFG